MTHERLEDLRRRVARGELGPGTAALVAELLEAYDEAAPTRERAESFVRSLGWTQDRRILRKWTNADGDRVFAGDRSLAADGALSLPEWRAFLVIAGGDQ